MKKAYLILFISLFNFFSFSQIDLNTINTDYISVLPGKAIFQPQKTSYGFAVITDAKNIMGYTSTGTKIFSKHLYKARKAFFSVLNNDFLAVISNNSNHLTLLNPDGKELWNTSLDYKVIDKPLSGRDGRFFIRGQKIIECYGITGIKKWSLDTAEQSNLKLEELNDGSIIVFLKEKKDSKTVGIRISPFGELLEEITFRGEITSSLTSPKGLLLNFSDGSAGLFHVNNNVSENKWVLQKENPSSVNNDFFVLSEDKNKIIYLNHNENSCEINFIDFDNGNIYKSFIVENIGKVKIACYNDTGIFLSDSKIAYFYNNYGRFLWSGLLNANNKKNVLNYTLYTPDNHFLLFYNNWSLHIYETSNISMIYTNNQYKKEKYEKYYTIDDDLFEYVNITKINEDLFSQEEKNHLLNGNYGKKEIDYASTLLSACASYYSLKNTSNFGTRIEKNLLETDEESIINIISNLSLYSCDTFTNQISQFIKSEKNSIILHHLLLCIQENPYDPENKLIDSIEVLLNSKFKKDNSLYFDICDAIYAICNFNGYKSLDYRGRDLLSSMLYPNYNSKVRDYARSTLKKL